MKKVIIFSTTALALAFFGACSTNGNKAIDNDNNNNENSYQDATGLHGEWRLRSYRIDCMSCIPPQFDSTSTYLLSFNEPDQTFSLITDCNTISGEYVSANDTIRFKNMFVTEMACDKMKVEQDMLRMLHDSTGYAVCLGDTILLTAPYIGNATFIKFNKDADNNNLIVNSTDSINGTFNGN